MTTVDALEDMDEPASRAGNGLALVATANMRARRAPRGLALTWMLETLMALAVTWPLAAWAKAAYGGHPEGDEPLFRPGGLALLELLDHTVGHVKPLLPLPVVITGLSALAGLVVYGILVGEMTLVARGRDDEGPTPAPLSALALRALGTFAPLLTLLVVVTFLQAVLVAGGMGAAAAVASQVEANLGEARASQVGGVVGLLGMGAALLLGLLHDVARAEVVRHRAGAGLALRRAWLRVRQAPLPFVGSWAWRGVAKVLLLAIGALAAERLGGRSGLPLLALAVVHQLVIAARLALRASWIAVTVRAVDR